MNGVFRVKLFHCVDQGQECLESERGLSFVAKDVIFQRAFWEIFGHHPTLRLVVVQEFGKTGSILFQDFVAEEPPFDGVFGHPWGFDGGSHPNSAGANASGYESIRAFDNIPVQGGQNEPTYTLVTGQLYVATPTSVIDADDPFG